jgi:transposase
MLWFCGIDVSKDRLDVMVLPEEQCCSVPNDAGGWATLLERLRNFSIAAIGLEASGGYERGVARRGAGKRPAMSTPNCPKM